MEDEIRNNQALARARKWCEEIISKQGISPVLAVVEAAREQCPNEVDSLIAKWRTASDEDEGGQEEAESKGKTSTQRLIELGRNAELFHNQRDEGFARFKVNARLIGCKEVEEHLEAWSLRSQVFRSWLTHQFYASEGKSPSSNNIEVTCPLIEEQKTS